MTSDGVEVIEIEGEADLTQTHELRARLAKLAADPPARAIVDLTRADFVDSSVLGALAFSAKAFGSSPSRFAVVCPPGEIRMMFELTALERILPVYDARTEALAFLGEGTPPG